MLALGITAADVSRQFKWQLESSAAGPTWAAASVLRTLATVALAQSWRASSCPWAGAAPNVPPSASGVRPAATITDTVAGRAAACSTASPWSV